MDVKDALYSAVHYHKQGKLDLARNIYEKILKENPFNSDAWHLLGLVEHQTGNSLLAVDFINKAINLKGDVAEYYGNLGMVYDKLGQEEESIKNFEKALNLNPYYDNSFLAHYNLGISYKEKGRLKDALAHYNKAIEIKKDFFDAYWNRGLTLLLLGNFLDGWKDYEFRFKKKDPTDSRRFGKPGWDGSPIYGKRILIASEQGFGDHIQFVRYLPMIKEKGGHVILECKKELRRLYENLEGVDELVDKEKDSVPKVNFDFYIHLMSLPFIFNTKLDGIPNKVPYFNKNWELSSEVCSKLNTDKFKVGLVWAGNPEFPEDKNRSTQFEKIKPLLEIPDVEFFSLQLGDASKQLDDKRATDIKQHISDFYDTAAIINNLDLIISTDTSVAHLAGALGKNIWVLLSYIPDWRWLLDRKDSPWYPTMKLFRQKEKGDWEGVIKEVSLELKNLVSN